MDYQKVVCPNYNIYLVNNKKFHDIEISINFTENVNKRKITERNILADLLTYSCYKYDTTSKLVKKCQELYSMHPKCSVNRYGNIIRTKFSLSIVDSYYVSKNNLIDNIELLSEIILHPCIEDNKLKSKYLELVKKILAGETLSIEEEPRLYANIKALKIMGKNEKYALTGFSDLKLLEEIDEEKLYKSYQKMLRESRIDIIISGNIRNQKKIVDAIKKYFVIKNKSNLNYIATKHTYVESPIKKVKEKKKIAQSKLCLIGKIIDVNEYEYKVVFNVFNEMFGTMGSCLLMKHVREKNNLCYYICSYYNKLDSIFVINSGVKKDEMEKAAALIIDTLKMATEGKFTNIDLKNAKAEYLNELEKLKDSNNNLCEYVYGREVFGSDTVQERIQLAKMITKEDIMNVAKKIKLCVEYYLEGEQ